MTSDDDAALLAVGANGDIQVRRHGPVLTCAGGTPTTSNIASILVVDDSDDPTTPAANDGNTTLSIVNPTDFVHSGAPMSWLVTFNMRVRVER